MFHKQGFVYFRPILQSMDEKKPVESTQIISMSMNTSR